MDEQNYIQAVNTTHHLAIAISLKQNQSKMQAKHELFLYLGCHDVFKYDISALNNKISL